MYAASVGSFGGLIGLVTYLSIISVLNGKGFFECVYGIRWVLCMLVGDTCVLGFEERVGGGNKHIINLNRFCKSSRFWGIISRPTWEERAKKKGGGGSS